MVSILTLSPKNIASKSLDRLLCYYVNKTNLIQVVQLANSPNRNFEKIIFPGQRLLFEAGKEAKLKIQTGLGIGGTEVLKDEVFCYSIRVFEQEEESAFD